MQKFNFDPSKWDAFKHSTNNKITLHHKKYPTEIILTKKALKIFLEEYILYVEQPWQIITQGWVNFNISKKFML